MAKRIKKPPVKPEMRREWLRRYEAGELPPKIADSDEFDVRTVRRHIELARQEREVREARSLVLRNALESHYRDLCEVAEKLDSEIASESIISPSLRQDPMLEALRKHLPRSPLWNKLNRWEHVLEEIAKLESDVNRQLREEIEAEPILDPILSAGERGVIPGMIAALTFQTKAWARGDAGLNIEDNFKAEPVEKGFENVGYGFSNMGKVQTGHVAPIKEVLIHFESRITNWDQYRDMQRLFAELQRLKLGLRDQLTIIIRRRVVTGRCKFCPL